MLILTMVTTLPQSFGQHLMVCEALFLLFSPVVSQPGDGPGSRGFCRHCRMWFACLHRGEARLGPTRDTELVINGTGFSNSCSPLLARGLSNSGTAPFSWLSPHTVNRHLHAALSEGHVCAFVPRSTIAQPSLYLFLYPWLGIKRE